MTKLKWGETGKRRVESGVSHGVLYLANNVGEYDTGVAWAGLTTVTESPSGAESNKQYADNRVWANLKSAEEFGGTIEAFVCPDEFFECDGSVEVAPGVYVGQQSRRIFGFSWRSEIGTDLDADAGYKINLTYGNSANPSERANTTVNESPEALSLSWEFTSDKVDVGVVGGKEIKPTAHIVIDSTKVDADALAALEDILYGTAGTDPRLPFPAEVFSLFVGTLTEVETVAPSYNATTDIITIPAVTGVQYFVDLGDGPVAVTAGPLTDPITEDTVVTARPAAGYKFTETSDTDWTINFA